MKKRWIFKKENLIIRLIAIFTSFFLALLTFALLHSIPIGTFFLFMSAYFLGAFTGRKSLEVIVNQSLESAISEISKLIDSSTTVIYILTRTLNPKIYNQIDVFNSIEDAKRRGVIIKVVGSYPEMKTNHLNDQNEIDKNILKLIADRRIELFHIDRDLEDVNHFIVVDRTNFRFEEIHNKTSNERKAILVYRSKRARSFHNLFEEILKKDHCKKITSDEVSEFLKNKYNR